MQILSATLQKDNMKNGCIRNSNLPHTTVYESNYYVEPRGVRLLPRIHQHWMRAIRNDLLYRKHECKVGVCNKENGMYRFLRLPVPSNSMVGKGPRTQNLLSLAAPIDIIHQQKIISELDETVESVATTESFARHPYRQ